MATNKPKSVTIELTPKQQERLRKVTDQACSEIRVEVARGRTARRALAAKAAPHGTICPLDSCGDHNSLMGVPRA